MSLLSQAIRPEALTAKLEAAAILEAPALAAQLQHTPRLVELLWFVQWKSFQPGGLEAFARELIAACPDGPCTVSTAPDTSTGQARHWTHPQCRAAWALELEAEQERWRRPWRAPWPPVGSEFTQWAKEALSAGGQRAEGNWFWGAEQFENLAPAQMTDGANHFNRDYFVREAGEHAAGQLPGYLKWLCGQAEEPDRVPYDSHAVLTAPKWFPQLLEALLAFMDAHAQRERERLPQTEVVKKIFDALDYAWARRKLVVIMGSSRFGKTEAIKAWCAAYPGRMRLVVTPWSNGVRQLECAVAETLGLPASAVAQVRAIVRHAQLGFVFDEAHFLFPSHYTSTTAPNRLNWVRTEIVDRELPCALVSTPQAYDGQAKRFEKKTGYNMDQFVGRIGWRVETPETLSTADMLAVARFHFPGLGEGLLKMAVAAAKKSKSYLKALQDIADRARWLSEKRGAPEPKLCDLEAAINEVVPGLAAREAELETEPEIGGVEESAARPHTIMQPCSSPIADLVQEVCKSASSGRRTPAPAGAAAPRRATQELVSA